MQAFSLNISYNQSQQARVSFNYPSTSLPQNHIYLLSYKPNEKHPNVINLVPRNSSEGPQVVERVSSTSDCFFEDFDFSKCLTPSTETQSCHNYTSSSKMMANSRKINKEAVVKNQNAKKNIISSSKKVKWTPEEDKKILKLLAKFGPKWTIIAEMMEGRAGKQVRERYLNVLRPGINHKEWTEEEDNLFMSLYSKFGKSWCQIAAHLPGRTESQVKNRFYTKNRKQSAKNSAKKDHENLKINKDLLSCEENFDKTLASPALSKDSSIDAFFNIGFEDDPYFAKMCARSGHDEIRWN